MRSFGAQLCFALLFVACVSRAQDTTASGQSQTSAPKMPGQISQTEAAALEAGLVTNPDNLTARESLIQYYFQEMVESSSSDLDEKRQKHIFWLIEHHPESELAGSPEAELMPIGFGANMEGYQRGRQLWMQQVDSHQNDQRILRNAAQFLQLAESKVARDLLEKAWAIDPGDTLTTSSLAQSYDQERAYLSSPEAKKNLAKKALSVRERGMENSAGEERFYELGRVATSALEAGEPEKAQQYATELLQIAPKFRSNWNYGNAILQGNVVLGRIALQRGDIAGAKEHLLAAGQTPGSPQLDSFGPNMTLAKELLEKGERDAVLAYLQSCAKFWEMAGDNLQAWTATIKGGGIPDFGAHLYY